ncbi:glycosyltransferase [Vibrio parahaemolyticus]
MNDKAKVCLFTSDLYEGGVAESTRKLAKYLISKEVDVTICNYDSLRIKKSISKNVRVVNLSCPLSVGFRKGKLLRTWVSIIRYFALPVALIKFLIYLNKYKPNTVYSMTYIPNILNIVGTYFFDYKCIVSERQDPREDLGENSIIGKLTKRLYPKADVIHANSVQMIDAIREYYKVDVKKIFHFDNFFYKNEIIKLSASSAIKLPSKASIRLVNSGRLSEQKGQWHLVKIIQKLRSLGVDVELYILGDGPLKSELISLTRQCGVEDYVTFLGNVDNPHSYVSQCDVFIFTSLWESFGNTLVEAMALGLPIISTSCQSGPGEIIGKGRFGLDIGLLPYYGEDLDEKRLIDICEKIKLLINNDFEKYIALSKEGFERYDVDNMELRINNLFDINV